MVKAICDKCGKRLTYFDPDVRNVKGRLVHVPCHKVTWVMSPEEWRKLERKD